MDVPAEREATDLGTGMEGPTSRSTQRPVVRSFPPLSGRSEASQERILAEVQAPKGLLKS